MSIFFFSVIRTHIHIHLNVPTTLCNPALLLIGIESWFFDDFGIEITL